MTQSPLSGTLIEGKYEILVKIKEGGMGSIYKVRHRLLDEERVVKVMLPQLGGEEEYKRRFAQEARMATRLKHPNIATIHDFALDPDGTAYIVMEFIDGVNLSELLKSSGPPGGPLSLEIAHQALLALAYLHRKNVVHRDVAPDNLMLTYEEEERPQIKLIDLGISKALDRTVELTSTGVFLGKLKYSSPEQLGSLAHGESLDARSDLYSMGIVLYELLTGRSPVAGNTPRELIGAHLFHPPIPFEETDRDGRVPPALREVVLKALQKKREDRFASAEEFDREILAVRQQIAIADDPEATRRFLSKARQSRGVPIDPVTPSAQGRLDRQFVAHSVPTDVPSEPLRFTEPVRAPETDMTLVDARGRVGTGGTPPSPVPPAAPAPPSPAPPAATPTPRPPPAPAVAAPPRRSRARSAAIGAAALAAVVLAALLLRPQKPDRAPEREAALPALAPTEAPAVATPEPPPAASTVPTPAAALQEPSPVPAESSPAPPEASRIRLIATQARSRAATSRASAERSGARERAAELFTEGRDKEREAANFLARGEYEKSISAYADASDLYAGSAALALSRRPTVGALIAARDEPTAILQPTAVPAVPTAAPEAHPATPVLTERPSAGPSEEERIRQAISRYEQAQNNLDVNLYVRVYPAIAARREAIEGAWRNLKSQRLEVTVRQIRVQNSHAEARVFESRVAVPRVGSEQRDSRERTLRLEKRGEGWVISAVE